jgi:1-acyl-sn-glycerol-3-phosphate acyltransferase
MSFIRFAVTLILKFVFRSLCRVDYHDTLDKFPRKGPLIMVANHINFLDIPFLYTSLYPRRLVGLVKRETWKNPAVGFLLDIWGSIPVSRGRSDVESLKEAKRALDSGKILVIAPEGTRSGDGILRRGRPGVVAIALHANAPILPVGHFGLERFWENAKKLRRTRVSVRAGAPFRIDSGGAIVGHALRSEISAEIMQEIAALLPEANRGAYADPDPASAPRRYLRPLS